MTYPVERTVTKKVEACLGGQTLSSTALVSLEFRAMDDESDGR